MIVSGAELGMESANGKREGTKAVPSKRMLSGSENPEEDAAPEELVNKSLLKGRGRDCSTGANGQGGHVCCRLGRL